MYKYILTFAQDGKLDVLTSQLHVEDESSVRSSAVRRNFTSGRRPLPARRRRCLRWLKTVSSTYIWMGPYNHSLALDATVMVSKNCSIIGEHVAIIFLTQ